ncbi:MAG: CAP domain-containing protein [Cyanobacteria bacterium P01_F01_bin.13]
MEFKALGSVVLISVMLTACGGGGGGGGGGNDGSSNDGSSSNSDITPEPVPVADSCETTLESVFNELLVETNRIRTDHQLSPLKLSYQLGQAAQNYAEDMATDNFFGHTGLDGSTIGSRITAAEYSFSSAAENIAAGYDSAISVVEAWFSSPGHRVNLLNPNYVDIGFGLFFNDDSRYGSYWVQEFGQPTADNIADERVYLPTNACSVGNIVNGTTAVLNGTVTASNSQAIFNETTAISSQAIVAAAAPLASVPDYRESVTTSGTALFNETVTTIGSQAIATATVQVHREPVATAEPATVLGILTAVAGVKFSRKRR